MDKFLGIKRKAPDQPSDQTCVKVKKSEHKSRDRWFSNWDKTFPWLQKEECENQVRGICTWCRDARKNNAMATTGTPNLQASTFSKHEMTKDHKLACEARQAKQKKETVVKVFEDHQAKQIDSECDPVKEAQFKTMYYLAKEGQPLNQYTRLLALQIKNKCPNLQDSKKLYTSEELKSEILDSINDSIEERVDDDIKNSEYLGLIIDESTDITVHKKLNVYVKCLNDMIEHDLYLNNYTLY